MSYSSEKKVKKKLCDEIRKVWKKGDDPYWVTGLTAYLTREFLGENGNEGREIVIIYGEKGFRDWLPPKTDPKYAKEASTWTMIVVKRWLESQGFNVEHYKRGVPNENEWTITVTLDQPTDS